MKTRGRKNPARSKGGKGKIENPNQNHNTKRVALGPNTKRTPR
jgi:hypothetical protein